MNERKTAPLTLMTQTFPAARSVFKNWRERYIGPLLLGTLVVGALVIIPALIRTASITLDLIFIIVCLAVLLAAWIRLPFVVRAVVFLVALFALGISDFITSGILGNGLFFLLGLIVFSTLLFSPWMGVMATVVSLLSYLLVAWLTMNGVFDLIHPRTLNVTPQDWFSAAAIILLLSVAIIFGFRRLMLEYAEAQKKVDLAVRELDKERTNLEQSVYARTAELRKINEIGRLVSASLNPQELYTRIVRSVSEQFDCYHTALYLVDPTGRWAELIEATGESGRVLKETHHKLEITAKNLVSTTIRERIARIDRSLDGMPVKTNNPLLPYTRSEVSLPLMIRDRLLGALDLHSEKESVFVETDIETLQSMANQIAVALENARLFARTEQSLDEMNAIQRSYVQNAWASLTGDKPMEFRLGDEELSEGAKEINVPLSLRDEIIGQISLASDSEWTPEQRNMIETIATQAALALENARLVEESQSTSIHDRLAADITSKVWAASTLEGILQTAVRELGRALGASEATIELEVGSNE